MGGFPCESQDVLLPMWCCQAFVLPCVLHGSWPSPSEKVYKQLAVYGIPGARTRESSLRSHATPCRPIPHCSHHQGSSPHLAPLPVPLWCVHDSADGPAASGVGHVGQVRTVYSRFLELLGLVNQCNN